MWHEPLRQYVLPGEEGLHQGEDPVNCHCMPAFVVPSTAPELLCVIHRPLAPAIVLACSALTNPDA